MVATARHCGTLATVTKAQNALAAFMTLAAMINGSPAIGFPLRSGDRLPDR